MCCCPATRRFSLFYLQSAPSYETGNHLEKFKRPPTLLNNFKQCLHIRAGSPGRLGWYRTGWLAWSQAESTAGLAGSSSWSPSEEADGREASLHCMYGGGKIVPVLPTNVPSCLPVTCVCMWGRRFHLADLGPCWLTIAYAIMPVGVVAGKATTDGAWSQEKKISITESGHFPEAPLEWNQAQQKVLGLSLFLPPLVLIYLTSRREILFFDLTAC